MFQFIEVIQTQFLVISQKHFKSSTYNLTKNAKRERKQKNGFLEKSLEGIVQFGSKQKKKLSEGQPPRGARACAPIINNTLATHFLLDPCQTFARLHCT